MTDKVRNITLNAGQTYERLLTVVPDLEVNQSVIVIEFENRSKLREYQKRVAERIDAVLSGGLELDIHISDRQLKYVITRTG